MIDVKKEKEKIKQAEEEFKSLISVIGQRRLSEILGTNESYLSRFKAGKKKISYEKLLDFFETAYLSIGKQQLEEKINNDKQ